MQKVEKRFDVCGKEIIVTYGNFGFRADTALMLQKGETVVMAFVTVDSKDSDLDYFPLGVNYIEKYYAGGIISGSRFVKRERRPSDEAVIKGRVIDRAIRPLFPEGFKRGVSITINVMSYDGINDPAILGANAAAMAIHASSVPFAGPVASVRVAMNAEGNLIVDPRNEDMENSLLDAVISCTSDAITQLEIEGNQIPESKMSEAFGLAFNEAQSWNIAMNDVKNDIGKEKIAFNESKVDPELVNRFDEGFHNELKDAVLDDENRNMRIEEIHNKVIESTKEEGINAADVHNALAKIEKKITRTLLLEGKRPSGRALDEIREIEILAQFLPRVHGSAMFRRGITQVLAITTLGSTRLAQTLENFEGESEKRFMHHYSGPNYSFGDAGRFNFYAGNREIGHGALAEKALVPVMPSEEEFPYAIRVVSEVLSQNGSTSMAATCGACLSLMDAGVPIKAPVAGISIGLITANDDQSEYKLLTDVQDIEDFYGDMDFKVTGTKDGITAIQMDTKLKGVKVGILQDALGRAKEARMIILGKYVDVLAQPRENLSEYAPRVKSIKIKQSKIGELIGPGGKVIKGILESVENKVEIDIKDDGTVLITSVDAKMMDEAIKQIEAIVMEPEVGKIYKAKVAKITTFGAFVDISAASSGLVHMSEIADEYVKDASKYLKVGQEVEVKVIGIDGEGRINLSIKAVAKDRA